MERCFVRRVWTPAPERHRSSVKVNLALSGGCLSLGNGDGKRRARSLKPLRNVSCVKNVLWAYCYQAWITWHILSVFSTKKKYVSIWLNHPISVYCPNNSKKNNHDFIPHVECVREHNKFSPFSVSLITLSLTTQHIIIISSPWQFLTLDFIFFLLTLFDSCFSHIHCGERSYQHVFWLPFFAPFSRCGCLQGSSSKPLA